MLCGLTNIVLRIKHYFRYSLKNKHAHCWCMNCKYFDNCYESWVIENSDEPYVDDEGYLHISDSEAYYVDK